MSQIKLPFIWGSFKFYKHLFLCNLTISQQFQMLESNLSKLISPISLFYIICLKFSDQKGKRFKLTHSPTIVKFRKIQITEISLHSSTVFSCLLLKIFLPIFRLSLYVCFFPNQKYIKFDFPIPLSSSSYCSLALDFYVHVQHPLQVGFLEYKNELYCIYCLVTCQVMCVPYI